MADTKISDLTLKATPVGADTSVIVDSVGGANKKITLATLPISTATQSAIDSASWVHPKDGFRLIETWMAATTAGSTAWTPTNNSGATSLQLATTGSGRIGVIRLSTSSSSIAAPSIALGGASVIFTGGEMALAMEADIILSALSTGSEEYVTRFGFFGTTTSATAPSNGIWIEYDRAVSGDFWKAVSSDGGVQTATVSAVVPTTNYVRLKVLINAAATSVTYYVDGVLIATHTTNIPTTTSDPMSATLQIAKTVGTTQRFCSMDWCIVTGGTAAV